MSVSNKKRKAILRGYPGRGIKQLSAELGLSPAEVRAVLVEEGKLAPRSWKKPALAALSVLALALAGWGAYSFLTRAQSADLLRVRDKLNILLVTVDTCRADRLGCYGYGPAQTPVMDSIADQGVLFSSAFALQPITLPSHATIMTGTHPAHHNVMDNGLYALPGEALTLAEALQGQGFSTAAVVSAFVVQRQFGLDQGFDHFDDMLSTGGDEGVGYREMPATETSDRAVEWIEENKDKRWMLWVHYFDPHAEYEAPERFRQAAGHPYDAEIAYVDHELSRVMAALDNNGLREKTLLILTSDHGEGLMEHAEPTHAVFLYDSTMHVPLVVSLPGAVPEGRRVERTVSLMDVAPTVLAALGIEVPEKMQGRSLLPLIYNETEGWEQAPVVMETEAPWNNFGWSPLRAVRHQGFKYVEAPRPELYDLAADPGETENVYEQNRGRAEAMKKTLERQRKLLAENALKGGARPMDRETRESLASLGYLFTGGQGERPSNAMPDPKDKTEVLSRMREAVAMKSRGRPEKAVAIMEELLEGEPRNRRVMNILATWHFSMNDYKKTERILKRIIRVHPGFDEAYYNLGAVYVATGRYEEAMQTAKTMMEKNPRSAKAYNIYGSALFRREKYARASEYFKKATKLYPGFAEYHFNLGMCYKRLGKQAKALQAIARALRINPANEKYREYYQKASELVQGD